MPLCTFRSKKYLSEKLVLQEGKLYYMEVLFKQGSQYGELQTGVILPIQPNQPNGTIYLEIPANYLRREVRGIGKSSLVTNEIEF